MMPLLRIEHLNKNFMMHHLNRSIKGCKEIHLNVPQGTFIGITGKSGSGKSTILKSIYRSYLPESGTIIYDSKAFGRINLLEATERQILYLRKYEIGYVSQFLNVMPRTTALQVVQNALLDMGHETQSALHQATAILEHFQLDSKLWDAYPNNFSGGEKLRLNVATAMVKSPRLLLLDEPTASLDGVSKAKVRDLLVQLKEAGTTMIGIFHDLEFMAGICDYEFNMERGHIVCNTL